MAEQFSHTPRKNRCPAAIRLAWRDHFSDDELDRAYAQVAKETWRVRHCFNVPVQFTLIDWLDLRVRAHHCCEYCGSGEWELVIDHYIPLIKGGAHTKENIRVSCARASAVRVVSASNWQRGDHTRTHSNISKAIDRARKAERESGA